MKRMLYENEKKEYISLKNKSKKYGINIKRVGPSNISFGNGVHTQLGTGNATTIMDAKIKLLKKKLL